MLKNYKTWIIASAVTVAVSMNVATVQAEDMPMQPMMDKKGMMRMHDKKAGMRGKGMGMRGQRMEKIETTLDKILAYVKKLMAHHDIPIDDAKGTAAPILPEPAAPAVDMPDLPEPAAPVAPPMAVIPTQPEVVSAPEAPAVSEDMPTQPEPSAEDDGGDTPEGDDEGA